MPEKITGFSCYLANGTNLALYKIAQECVNEIWTPKTHTGSSGERYRLSVQTLTPSFLRFAPAVSGLFFHLGGFCRRSVV
jgi:hypothetical protein